MIRNLYIGHMGSEILMVSEEQKPLMGCPTIVK
jgi:hypothetical protein